ncbi:hypothetical protein B0A53_00889 [Rhodotorula sp. CCFEE 5036]|nr:hypothetical protein B0A53_00889 [Rhodotorula sp. CCFEE 5036]
MDRAGASSESQGAHCPPPPPPTPPPPRPTTSSHASSHQSSAPITSSVVSPSTQARQAFKFAAPAAAARGAAPPVATKRPPSLSTTGASVATPPVAGTPSLTTSRLRQFQSSAATDPNRALPRAWVPATAPPGVTGDLDADDTDDVDEVVLAGQTLDLVKQLDAAQRQLAAPLSTEKEAKKGRPLQEEAAAIDSREKVPKGDLESLRRDRTSHKSQSQASSRGPRPFQPTRSSNLRGETRSSSSAAFGTSEDTPNATTEPRKRTSLQEPADAPVQKRQKENPAEKGDDSTQKSSREVTPRTDPPACEVEGQKTDKKSTASRPSTTDRFKRSSGSRSSESRSSRPATSAAFFDETMANLRRWQRHEGELDEELRRLKTQLDVKDQELVGARAKLDKLKSDLSDKIALASANARNAENEYKATVVQMRSTLDTYRDQLASELAELRAQVCRTKTELGPLADSTVEGHASLESEKRKLLQALQADNEKCKSPSVYWSLKKELGTVVGELTETRERLDAEVERATTAAERADRNAEKLDEVRKGAADEVSRLSKLTRQLSEDEVELRIQHEEQLQARASAQEELRQELQKKLDEHEQHARHAIADLEQRAGELRARIAELDEEAAAAAHEHAKELSELRSDVVEKEQMVHAAEERARKAEAQVANAQDEVTQLSVRLQQAAEEAQLRDKEHDQSIKHLKENFSRTRDELSRELEQAKVKIGEATTALKNAQTERDSLLASEHAARQAADQARSRLEAWEAEAREQSQALAKAENATKNVEARLKAAEAKAEAINSEKEHVQRQLDAAQSLIASLKQSMDKRQAHEESAASLRREVNDLTAAAADAIAEKTRALDAKEEMEKQLEAAIRANETFEAERAESRTQIDSLESQVQELQAKAQQAAESTIAGAAPTEVDMETCKLAFETEKQEAVRKAIETCNERSKVDQMQLQNDLKRTKNRLIECEQKLNKAQADLIQAKAAQQVNTPSTQAQSSRHGKTRPPLFTGGTPVSVSSSTISTRSGQGQEQDSPIKDPTKPTVDEIEQPLEKAPKRRRSAGSAAGGESQRATRAGSKRVVQKQEAPTSSIDAASDDEFEQERAPPGRTLSRLAAQDDDDEDMLEEEMLGQGNLNENEDDPIEDSLTQAPHPPKQSTVKPSGWDHVREEEVMEHDRL